MITYSEIRKLTGKLQHQSDNLMFQATENTISQGGDGVPLKFTPHDLLATVSEIELKAEEIRKKLEEGQ